MLIFLPPRYNQKPLFLLPNNNNIKKSYQEITLSIENKKHFTIIFISIARLLQSKHGPCYQ